MAQTITVHLIDFRNGKPLGEQRVEMLYPDSDHRVHTLSLKTDSPGVAEFAVPSPNPERLMVVALRGRKIQLLF